jgi:aspartate/methionine/tyrosine aminotransferase
MAALASRLERVRVAASVAMTVRARELRAQGADVIALTIGEPDFASPRTRSKQGIRRHCGARRSIHRRMGHGR